MIRWISFVISETTGEATLGLFEIFDGRLLLLLVSKFLFSSANFDNGLGISSSISFMYNKKRREPSTDPCGTLLVTKAIRVMCLWEPSFVFLSDSQFSIHSTIDLSIFMDVSFSIKLLCGTLSKALRNPDKLHKQTYWHLNCL